MAHATCKWTQVHLFLINYTFEIRFERMLMSSSRAARSALSAVLLPRGAPRAHPPAHDTHFMSTL